MNTRTDDLTRSIWSSAESEPGWKRDTNKKLLVRQAHLGQAESIARIADAVNVHKYAYLGKGFLVYTLSVEEYRKRISDGQHVYVFSLNGKVVGFVCGYGRQQFEGYLSDGTLGHEPTIGRNVRSLAVERGDEQYAFLDQIAVLPAYQDRGLGEVYFHRFCAEVKGPYYVAMVEGPLRNPRIDYWRSRGFMKIGEVEEELTDRFVGVKSLQSPSTRMLWGIYVLPQSGFTPIRQRGLEIPDRT